MLGDIFYDVLGYIILLLKYPNKKERKKVLNEKYDGSYITVGAEWPLKIFGAILFILLIGLLVAVIYSIFVHGPAQP